MGLLDPLLGEFVDIIEWNEDGTDQLVWRFPRYKDAIKWGAQLIVREGQRAVFVNEGRIADCFEPGRHRLSTRNLPLLSTLLALPTAFESPFKAEVYFIAMRRFTDQRWGTKHPVLLRDAELGPIRLRGFGTFGVQVSDPLKLIRSLNGSNSTFKLEEIQLQLRNLIVSRLADLLGESTIPALDLAAHYDELASDLNQRLASISADYGLQISNLLVENLALPAEVEAAIDRRAAIGLTGDLDAFRTYQEGIALEKAASNPAGMAAGAAGLAMGFGLGERIQTPSTGANPKPDQMPDVDQNQDEKSSS
ncbi:MAG: SPFH domain-containing protein [Parasynechococcus sp.]